MRITKYSMVCEKVTAYNDPGITATTPENVARIFTKFYPGELLQEHVALLCLNVKGAVTGFHEISKGTLTSSMVDVKQVLIAALNTPKTTAVIMMHNHPSGAPDPSEEDNAVTQRLKKAFDLVEMKLLDHVIIGDDCCYSYHRMGDL